MSENLKDRMTREQYKKCNAIIHSASVAAAGVGTGLAQIPLADSAVLCGIQTAMIIELGQVFGIQVTETMAKAGIASAGTAAAGRMITQILWGWIPVVGNAINATTAGGLTEAIGWLMTKEFVSEKEAGKG